MPKKLHESKTELSLRTDLPPSHIVGILNTPTLNQLFAMKSKEKPIKINKLLGDEAQFELISADKERSAFLFIEKYTKNKQSVFKLRTKKLLDFLIWIFSETNSYKEKDSKVSYTVNFSLEEYALALGKPNPKSASTKRDVRRILGEALDAIRSYSLETYEKRGAEVKHFGKMRICQDYIRKNGVYTVHFSKEFAEYLISGYVMKFPFLLFSVDERSSNGYAIARKLALHQSINNNKKKGMNNIISVKSLLATAPDIPSIKEVREYGGSWGNQIEEKLTLVLDKLTENVNVIGHTEGIGILKNWEYCGPKGTPISEELLEDATYYNFSNRYVRFSVRGLD